MTISMIQNYISYGVLLLLLVFIGIGVVRSVQKRPEIPTKEPESVSVDQHFPQRQNQQIKKLKVKKQPKIKAPVVKTKKKMALNIGDAQRQEMKADADAERQAEEEANEPKSGTPRTKVFKVEMEEEHVAEVSDCDSELETQDIQWTTVSRVKKNASDDQPVMDISNKSVKGMLKDMEALLNADMPDLDIASNTIRTNPSRIFFEDLRSQVLAQWI